MDDFLRKLHQRFHYDPETGHLTYKEDTIHNREGDRAGHESYKSERRGGGPDRRSVYFMGHNHPEHRLIWYWVHGRWPIGQIDHINRNPFDNRLENLRDVSASVNSQNMKVFKNSKSGYRYIRHHQGRYYVRISVPGARGGAGKQFMLKGGFRTAKEAIAARNRYIHENRHMFPMKIAVL